MSYETLFRGVRYWGGLGGREREHWRQGIKRRGREEKIWRNRGDIGKLEKREKEEALIEEEVGELERGSEVEI